MVSQGSSPLATAGQYLLDNPFTALAGLFVLTGLAVFHVPVLWLALVILGFLSMAELPFHPLWPVLIALIPWSLYHVVHNGFSLLLWHAVVLTCLVAGLASGCRWLKQWKTVVEYFNVTSVALVILLSLALPGLGNHWLEASASSLATLPSEQADIMRQTLQRIAPFVLGVEGLGISVSALIYTALASLWFSRTVSQQAKVAGGHHIRVSITQIIMLGVLLVLAYFTTWPGFTSALILMVLPCVLASASLFHAVMAAQGKSVAWFYLAIFGLMLINPLIVLAALIMLSLFDAVLDLRKKLIR